MVKDLWTRSVFFGVPAIKPPFHMIVLTHSGVDILEKDIVRSVDQPKGLRGTSEMKTSTSLNFGATIIRKKNQVLTPQ
eukprot:581501-Amphidinium_carterae.1